MNATEIDIELHKEWGITHMKQLIEMLEQRIRQWEKGTTHSPRLELEKLSEVMVQQGAIEALDRIKTRERITQ